MNQTDITTFIAFIAGVVSFFSPCILPLLPVYISYITGISVDKLAEGNTVDKNKILPEIILFVLGFSVVFILLGASASSLGKALLSHQKILKTIGGIIIILFGLQVTGLIKFKFLEYEKRIQLKAKPLTIFGSLLMGMAFAAGWTPCIGPILGSIITVAAARETVWQGITLLSFYSLGLAVPFLLIGLALNWCLKMFAKAKKYLMVIYPASGVLLIVFGILMLLGKF